MVPELENIIRTLGKTIHGTPIVSSTPEGSLTTVLCSSAHDVTPTPIVTNYEIKAYSAPTIDLDYLETINSGIRYKINKLELQLVRESVWDAKRISREIKHLRKRLTRYI